MKEKLLQLALKATLTKLKEVQKEKALAEAKAYEMKQLAELKNLVAEYPDSGLASVREARAKVTELQGSIGRFEYTDSDFNNLTLLCEALTRLKNGDATEEWDQVVQVVVQLRVKLPWNWSLQGPLRRFVYHTHGPETRLEEALCFAGGVLRSRISMSYDRASSEIEQLRALLEAVESLLSPCCDAQAQSHELGFLSRKLLDGIPLRSPVGVAVADVLAFADVT